MRSPASSQRGAKPNKPSSTTSRPTGLTARAATSPRHSPIRRAVRSARATKEASSEACHLSDDTRLPNPAAHAQHHAGHPSRTYPAHLARCLHPRWQLSPTGHAAPAGWHARCHKPALGPHLPLYPHPVRLPILHSPHRPAALLAARCCPPDSRLLGCL